MFLLAENWQTGSVVSWRGKRVIFSAMGSLEKCGSHIYILVRFNNSNLEYFLSKLLFLLISVAFFRLNLWLNLFLWITNSFLMYIYIYISANKSACVSRTVRLCVCMCGNTHKGVQRGNVIFGDQTYLYYNSWDHITHLLHLFYFLHI